MQITSSVVNSNQTTSFRVAGAANNKPQTNQIKAEKEKKDSKSISMADSELVQNSNKIEGIIKRFDKQKEIVQKQIEQVNKNEIMTVEEKKEKLTELTDKLKMLDDEKTAAIFEENQKKIEEERQKQEEAKEKDNVKREARNETNQPESSKDMEHALKVGMSFSRISKLKQTKAEMSRQAGRMEGEIANDIMSTGVTSSYSEAKIKAAAGVNPYRANDWKIKQYNKLTTGISNLEKSVINEVAEINKESSKYGKIKVEFAKEEATKDTDKNKSEFVKADNEQAIESTATEETTSETKTTGQNAAPEEKNSTDKTSHNENKIVGEAHTKYKNSDAKKIDKKGTVIDTDL